MPGQSSLFTPPRRHILHSDAIGQDFQIDVMLPFREARERRHYPVIYATDANSDFDALKGIAYGLQRTGLDAPPFILVGIGYPGDSPRTGRFLRRRDFTPPGYPILNLLSGQEAQPGELRVPENKPDLHGADNFIHFLESTLLPFVESKYPVSGDRTIFGHSGGALLGLYTLFTSPHVFDRYILSSPCIVYKGPDASGDLISSEFLRPYLVSYLASPPGRAKRLFASVGSLEEAEAPHWRMVSSLVALVAELQEAERPDLELFHEILEGETHMSAWPIAFIHGLRAVLPGKDWGP